MDITILGIESSCDDTSAAVLRNNVLLSNVIASQAVHVKYGGVIPELASRAPQQNIIPVVDTALKAAGVTKTVMLTGDAKKVADAVAAELGVSRQAVAKWETGETTPDLSNCLALAQFYDVSLDDLVRFDSTQTGLPFPPKGKYCFGTVTVQEDGTIQLPQRAQDIFRLQPGASVLLLGDEERGLALLNANAMQELQTMLVDK